MGVVILILKLLFKNVVESWIHNYLCIYVNLCQNFKVIGLHRKFVHRHLIVHSIKPVNIFSIG